MSVRDEYAQAMIDAADALRKQARNVSGLAAFVDAQVADAIADADLADGPPDVGQMLGLYARLDDVVNAARNTQDEWRRLNSAAQSWSVVMGRKHYYADVTEID